MLINEWAIVLNLLSIALVGLLAAAVFLALIWPFTVRYIAQLSACTQKKVLWLFMGAPWIASVICVFVFLPSLFQLESLSWLSRLAHWHHPYVFYLDSWHSITLLIFILGAAYVLFRKGLTAVRYFNALASLSNLSRDKARHREIGRDVVVLESHVPSAFTAGLFSPKCYVTTGLVKQVSETELDIIVAHERAHIKHKDTRKKLLFALVASLYPRPVAQRFNRLFSVATEQLADAQVGKTYSVFDIAQTLVNAARIQRISGGNMNPAGVSYFIADDVDVRVRALIAPQEFRPFSWGNCLLIMTLTTILSLAGVDSLHHLIEAIFSH